MSTTISATALNQVCRYLGDYAEMLKHHNPDSTRAANRARIITRLITRLKTQ